jgi:hypothetical protein
MNARLRLAAAAAFLASLITSPASAENRTTIEIGTVLASNEGRVFDARLSGLKTELRQLRFRSYKLVSSETRVLHGNGGQCGMELPHGRYLHITTREHTPDHLRLHILLNEDNRPVVNTYVKLEMGSVVLLGGPRDQDGTLVITLASRPTQDADEEMEGYPARPVPQSDSAPLSTTGSAVEAAPSIPLPPADGVPAGLPAHPGAAGR